MKSIFTKTILLTTASCALILAIATITNLNAVFQAEAVEDSSAEVSTDEATPSVQTDEPASTSPANSDSANNTTAADSNNTDNVTNINSTNTAADDSKALQDTIEQIVNDQNFQDYSRVFDLVEQAETLDKNDRAAENRLKGELLSALAKIGGGANLASDNSGSLQTKTLAEILKDTSLIANYQEYYELANLVKAAQTIIASDKTSNAQISQILQTTTNAAKNANIPLKNSTKQSTSPNNSIQNRADNSSDKIISASDTNTRYDVNRTIFSHTETTHSEDDTEHGSALANALAHTTTTCVAFGTLIIGTISAKRQK